MLSAFKTDRGSIPLSATGPASPNKLHGRIIEIEEPKMARDTRKELREEIERAGKVAKFSPAAIQHIVDAVKDRSRIATFSMRTKNGYKNPLVLAGILDADTTDVLDNRYVKAETKINKFLAEFAPGGVAKESSNTFVNVV